MKLPLVGEVYEHPSQDVNYQKHINVFPSPAGPGGLSTSNFVLLPTAGKNLLIDLTGLSVRAVMFFDNHTYAVVDNNVYEFTVDTVNKTASTAVLLGTLNTSTGPVDWAINPTQILIVDGSAYGYYITPSAATLTQIADADFTGGVRTIYADGYFIYNTPSSSTMYATAINNAASVAAIDVATAESKQDKVIGLVLDKRELWVLGERSTEIWYDAANATGFPFSRREGAYIDHGCGAAFSIINFDNTIYWLDDRGYIGRVGNGYQFEVISTPAISAAIRGYDTVSDCYAWAHADRGHLFLNFTFPSESITWTFDGLTSKWHQRGYFTQSDTLIRDNVSCAMRYKQMDIVGDFQSGKIYHLSPDYYSDNGDPIHRIFTTQHFTDEFHQIAVPTLELKIETGKALTLGTGSSPYVMLRYSNDGGYSYSAELPRSLGTKGQYNHRVSWNRLGAAKDWLFEFRLSDPIKFAIIAAAASIEGANS